MHNCFL